MKKHMTRRRRQIIEYMLVNGYSEYAIVRKVGSKNINDVRAYVHKIKKLYRIF